MTMNIDGALMSEENERLRAQLDILTRELAGEPPDSLAADYGGTGYEQDPAIKKARSLIAHMHSELELANNDCDAMGREAQEIARTLGTEIEQLRYERDVQRHKRAVLRCALLRAIRQNGSRGDNT